MAHRSEREMHARMIGSAFESALDDLHGFATQPPSPARVADDPWADQPTQLARVGFQSERLDAAALFGDLPVAPPASAGMVEVLDVVPRSITPPVIVTCSLPAPRAPRAAAPLASNDGRLIAIAVIGALALVTALAALSHYVS